MLFDVFFERRFFHRKAVVWKNEAHLIRRE